MLVHIMRSSHNRGIKLCCQATASGLLLLAMVFTAQAAEPQATTNPQITRLQAQIDALTKRLDKLEKKVQLNQHPLDQHPLSQKSPETTSQVVPARSGLTALHETEELKTNWKKLQRGLSETQLLQLLGKPDSKTSVNNQTLWYYVYPVIGRGSVMFGYDGKVSAWQKPPF